MNDKQILNQIDKSVLKLCVVGQSAARAQKEVLKAFRKGFLALPMEVMEKKVREHCEVLVNHAEPAVSDLYPGFQRALRYAARDAGLEISFSKKNNAEKSAKIVTVTLAVTVKDEPAPGNGDNGNNGNGDNGNGDNGNGDNGNGDNGNNGNGDNGNGNGDNGNGDNGPNVTVLPEQPAPKQQTVSGTSSNGSKGSDTIQTTDTVDPAEANRHALVLKALDIILMTEDQISAEQLFKLVATHYPRLALKQRYAFSKAFDSLVSEVEKAFQGGRTGTNG